MPFTSLHLRRIFRDSLKLYFAPLRGAFKGVRQELGRVDREIARERNRAGGLASLRDENRA